MLWFITICAKGIRVQRKTRHSLWCKYETELTDLRSFAKEILGIGNLAELPSGSTQLRHMKKPLVQALWTAKHPVEILFYSLLIH
jgi:hypothetical protein